MRNKWKFGRNTQFMMSLPRPSGGAGIFDNPEWSVAVMINTEIRSSKSVGDCDRNRMCETFYFDRNCFIT